MNELLTKSEVAKILKIHGNTLIQWEKSGLIPKRLPGWPGTDARWSRVQIDRFIESLERDERLSSQAGNTSRLHVDV